MKTAQQSAPTARIVRVALPVPLAQPFDYLEAGLSPKPGARVRVPFGRGYRIGIVLETTDEAQVARTRLRPIVEVIDAEPLFDTGLLADLRRAAAYWCGAVGEVLAGALPLALRGGRNPGDFEEAYWRATEAGSAARESRSRRGRSAALLDALAGTARSAGELDTLVPGWRAAARRLVTAGLVERAGATAARPQARDAVMPTLTDEQSEALATIRAAGHGFHAFLLQGVTGSGKTEVYLRLTEHVVADGRQALWLVPEIGLVPQALARLRARFDAPIAVLHSNLAETERARAWLDARAGRAAIVLGTRSAVFVPLPRAGLIVVDEEHDGSYKQQEGFRYHARDFALLRAQSLQVPIVLGSATPALETLANAEAGRYARVALRARVHTRSPSPVHVLDLRGLKLAHGLSPALLDALDACLARGEQALVFRNRRGYAPVLLCHACGWHAACPNCDKPLTLYRGHRRLRCHHCGYGEPVPARCPQCAGEELIPQGHGTERLEEVLAARYPGTPVLRVDRDTTRRRDAFARLLGKLAEDRPAVLVGTQMLAKGHDLPNLTTVAITGVDEGLHSVDFRAGEKLAQIIVQVAGRAGRAGKPGAVWLQTHEPGNRLLTTLLQGGYAAAATLELGERRAAGLPPFTHLVLLRAESRQRDVLDRFIAAAHASILHLLRSKEVDAQHRVDVVHINGPLDAPMPLRGGRHRVQLLLESMQRAALHNTLDAWLPLLRAVPRQRSVRWSVDVDPVDLY